MTEQYFLLKLITALIEPRILFYITADILTFTDLKSSEKYTDSLECRKISHKNAFSNIKMCLLPDCVFTKFVLLSRKNLTKYLLQSAM